MKTNHLFASAAYAAALVVALPAHAQILGGGMHGGVTGMQAATVGGGFGAVGRSASDRTPLSAPGPVDGRVDGLGRVDRSAKAGTQQATRDAGHAKADAAVAGHQAVDAGEFEASKGSNAALSKTRAAAGSTAATSVTAAGQGEAQARNADAVGALDGGLSPGAKPGADNPEPSTGRRATTTKPDSPST